MAPKQACKGHHTAERHATVERCPCAVPRVHDQEHGGGQEDDRRCTRRCDEPPVVHDAPCSLPQNERRAPGEGDDPGREPGEGECDQHDHAARDHGQRSQPLRPGDESGIHGPVHLPHRSEVREPAVFTSWRRHIPVAGQGVAALEAPRRVVRLGACDHLTFDTGRVPEIPGTCDNPRGSLVGARWSGSNAAPVRSPPGAP